MTSKKALNNIKYIDLHGRYPYPYYLKDDLEYKESIEILEELVERDTPMKIKHENNGIQYCAVCERSYLRDGRGNQNRFCGYCGQRLDWRDWNERRIKRFISWGGRRCLDVTLNIIIIQNLLFILILRRGLNEVH